MQTNSPDLKNNNPILLRSYLSHILVITCSKTEHNITQIKFKLLVCVQSSCTKIIRHFNKYIKIQKQRICSRLRLRDFKNRTPTPHPWYQVHTTKTFNKINQMHVYGVVYLNTGNDLYVTKDMTRIYQLHRPQACKNQMHVYGVVYLNTGNDLYVTKDMTRIYQLHRPQACKNWMLKYRTILSPKTLFWTSDPIKSISFRGLCPLTPDKGLCAWTPLLPDPRYRLALPRSPCSSPRTSKPNSAHGYHNKVWQQRRRWYNVVDCSMKWQAVAAVLLVTMIVACESFMYPEHDHETTARVHTRQYQRALNKVSTLTATVTICTNLRYLYYLYLWFSSLVTFHRQSASVLWRKSVLIQKQKKFCA